ncbi:MAG TPA: hypothetical protein VGF97_17715 [Rhizomicrobium sp.]|jgi:hypothetical protein
MNVLLRKAPKVRLAGADRALFVFLYRLFPSVLDAIAIVKPETVLRWHRAGFGAWWRWKTHVLLAFYNQVAERSGFYEIPKKLLLTVGGDGNNIWPFQSLVERHRKTGEAMAPNANEIMKDLIGHASELGLTELAEVFRDAFDPDVRNAVAHADYIIWQDGLRLRRRNGGYPRVIPWDEFDALMCRGLNLFSIIRGVVEEYVESYDPPKTIRSRMNKNEPEDDYTIYLDRENGAFGFTTEKYPPDERKRS